MILNLLAALLLLTLLPLKAAAVESYVCEQRFANLQLRSDRFAKVETKLGRPFSAAERSAIEEANALGVSPTYTPSMLKDQDALLRAAGLRPHEIGVLRRESLLSSTRVDFNGVVPESAKVIDLALDPISAKTLQSKSPVRYIVDSENNIFTVRGDHDLNPETLWLINNSNSGSQTLHLVKETGFIHPGVKNRVEFRPAYSLDTTRQEVEERLAELERQPMGFKVQRQTLATEAQNRVLHCADILAKNTSLKSAILDRLVADNLVVGAAIATSEVMGAARMASREGRQVVLADFIGSNINSVLAAVLGKYLVQSGKSLPVSLITRTAVAFGMIEVQKNVYRQVLDKDAEKRSDKIANFDRAYFMLRLPVSHVTDQLILKKLPEVLFNACKRDSKIAVYITPRSVRIAERFASTILYYGVRSAAVSE